MVVDALLARDLLYVTGKGVTHFAIDPRQALKDWMRAQPGGAVAAATLGRARAFTQFVDAAPGALFDLVEHVDGKAVTQEGDEQ